MITLKVSISEETYKKLKTYLEQTKSDQDEIIDYALDAFLVIMNLLSAIRDLFKGEKNERRDR